MRASQWESLTEKINQNKHPLLSQIFALSINSSRSNFIGDFITSSRWLTFTRTYIIFLSLRSNSENRYQIKHNVMKNVVTSCLFTDIGVEFKHTMCVVSEKFSVRGTKLGVSNLNIVSLGESFSVRRLRGPKRGETFSVRSSRREQFWPFLTKTDIGFSVRASHREVFTKKNVCLFSI